MDLPDTKTVLFWKKCNASARVKAMVRLERAVEEAHQALAEIQNITPSDHSARPVIALMVSKLYANVDGETVSDGSLFSLKDTLELLSRLE